MSPPDSPPAASPRPPLVWGALFIVYVVWGSTYLAIKVAIETMPPLLMAGARFAIAGGLLYGLLRLQGRRLGGLVPWRNAFLVGTALLAGGNGGVSWAEQTVPSGIAALVIGSVPLWFALVDWVRPGGTAPSRRTWTGIALGFAGLGILGAPAVAGQPVDPAGFAVLLVACVFWASGSIYSRHTPNPGSPWLTVGAQMLCGGLVLLVASAVSGEAATFDWRGVSARSFWALVYLIVAGSWIGFSAYIWLLRATTPARVSSYAYVNPVVAVLLGWAVLGEPLTPRIGIAATVILTGVIALTLPARRPTRPPCEGPAGDPCSSETIPDSTRTARETPG
ncbi:MAG: EamA family transporter [Verrucomicrobiae bacterium]|nr:EamA family transporter [Verrucomicrobiae bacterium]